MDTNFIIAQVFGVLGIIANVSSMQFKKRKQILAALLCLNLFSALNFIFLNKLSSAYISLFAVIEIIINYLFESRKKEVPKPLVALYAVISIILGSLNFTGLIDLLPIACAILFCITIVIKKEQHIRVAMLLTQLLWFIFDISVGAYVFSLSNLFAIVSTLIAIRHYRL